MSPWTVAAFVAVLSTAIAFEPVEAQRSIRSEPIAVASEARPMKDVSGSPVATSILQAVTSSVVEIDANRRSSIVNPNFNLGSDPRDYRWEGLWLGAAIVGGAAGLLSYNICSLDGSGERCILPAVGGIAVGAVMGGTVGGLIGRLIQKPLN